jgi:hypothetical protein
MIIFVAKFIGTNSLFYEKGKMYKLKATAFNDGIWIERLDGTGKCFYASLYSFLKNWNEIKSVQS